MHSRTALNRRSTSHLRDKPVGCCFWDNEGCSKNNSLGRDCVGTAKRPGRPWTEARGACKEINDLVRVLRDWLDASNVSVARLHRLLTPEHFGGDVPA